MNDLTTKDLDIIALSITHRIIEEKEDLATIDYNDDFLIEKVNKLKELNKVLTKTIRLKRELLENN